MTLEQLHERGFDQSAHEASHDANKTGFKVKCSQCDALCINGVPCHEEGCPNQTHECAECDTQIPKRQRLCESCANPQEEDSEWEQALRDEIQDR